MQMKLELRVLFKSCGINQMLLCSIPAGMCLHVRAAAKTARLQLEMALRRLLLRGSRRLRP